MIRGNWIAMFAVAVCCLGSLNAQAQTTKPAAKLIDIEQFDKLRQEKNHVVLDVRTAQGVQSGTCPGGGQYRHRRSAVCQEG